MKNYVETQWKCMHWTGSAPVHSTFEMRETMRRDESVQEMEEAHRKDSGKGAYLQKQTKSESYSVVPDLLRAWPPDC